LLIVIIFVSRLLWFVDAPYHAEPRTTGFYFFFPLHRPGENQIQSRRNNRLITATVPEKLNSRGMSNFSATPNFRQFQGLIHLSLVEVRENTVVAHKFHHFQTVTSTIKTETFRVNTGMFRVLSVICASLITMQFW
jgi:hypothetical protein